MARRMLSLASAPGWCARFDAEEPSEEARTIMLVSWAHQLPDRAVERPFLHNLSAENGNRFSNQALNSTIAAGNHVPRPTVIADPAERSEAMLRFALAPVSGSPSILEFRVPLSRVALGAVFGGASFDSSQGSILGRPDRMDRRSGRARVDDLHAD